MGSGSVLGFRFLSPLGSAKFSLEPVGLMKVAIKPCDMGKISLNLCNRAYSGFQKSPLALEQIRPGLYLAFGFCSAGLALSPGSRARA